MASDVLIKIGADNRASAVLKKIGGDVDRFGTKAQRAGANMKKMFTGFLVAAAAHVSIRAVGDEMERIDKIAKTGRKLGIFTEDLIAMRMAAAEMSGMAEGSVDMALQRMTRRISEAAQGFGEGKKAIDELGLDAAALNAAGPAEAFKLIADRIKEVKNPADQLRLSFKLFDSEGAALVNTLKGGSSAIDDMKKKADAMGLTFTDLEANRIEAANDAFFELKKTLQGLGRSMLVEFAPALTTVSAGLTTVIDKIGSLLTKSQAGFSFAGSRIAEAIMPGQLAPTLGASGMQSAHLNIANEVVFEQSKKRMQELSRKLQARSTLEQDILDKQKKQTDELDKQIDLQLKGRQDRERQRRYWAQQNRQSELERKQLQDMMADFGAKPGDIAKTGTDPGPLQSVQSRLLTRGRGSNPLLVEAKKQVEIAKKQEEHLKVIADRPPYPPERVLLFKTP